MENNWVNDAKNALNEELGWDDEIVEESSFVILKPGKYSFTVRNLERGRFEGSDKMGPCNKATIELSIFNEQGQEAMVREQLLLNRKMEWKLSEFFISIGQKKHGEPLKMNWSKVLGSTGRCEIKNEEYNGNTYNRVKKFLEAEASQGFTPGRF